MRKALSVGFDALAFLLLLLLLATAAAWVRSHWRADAYAWSWDAGAVQAGVASGRLRLDRQLLRDGSHYTGGWAQAHYAAADDPPTRRLPARISNLGFGWEHVVYSSGNESAMVLIPLWFIAGVAGTGAYLSRVVARRQLARARQSRGLCPACGYDLTANQSGVCPECGRVVGKD